MTHVTHLNIGGNGASVTLACNHVVELGYRLQLPRPGSSYDCPDCRAQEAQALAETCSTVACPNCRAQQTALLAAPFTPEQLDHLRFYRWLRQTGRAES